MKRNKLFIIKDLVYRKYLLFLNIIIILLPFSLYGYFIKEDFFNQYYWIWFAVFVVVFIIQKTSLKDYEITGQISIDEKSIDVSYCIPNIVDTKIDYGQIELIELITDGSEGQKNEWVYYVNLQEKTGKGNLNIRLKNTTNFSFRILRMPRLFYADDLRTICKTEGVKCIIIT